MIQRVDCHSGSWTPARVTGTGPGHAHLDDDLLDPDLFHLTEHIGYGTTGTQESLYDKYASLDLEQITWRTPGPGPAHLEESLDDERLEDGSVALGVAGDLTQPAPGLLHHPEHVVLPRLQHLQSRLVLQVRVLTVGWDGTW